MFCVVTVAATWADSQDDLRDAGKMVRGVADVIVRWVTPLSRSAGLAVRPVAGMVRQPAR
ncbi:hypothetical protein L083_4854 [Actinoplanes sp. N902-109]|nr:hypothetical protein L083_4854 [Actinoplanes sp. N902-109]